MTRGRKRLPESLKRLKGTQRKHRLNPNQPEQSSNEALPIMPLSDRETHWFYVIKNRLASIGLDSSTYTETITLLAKTMDRIDTLDSIVKNQGFVNGGKTHPAARMLNTSIDFANKLLRELGLSPASIIARC